VFIMAGLNVHDDRNPCSPSVGIGVHVRPEWPFTMGRNTHSRRVQILGSTPFPNDAFMRQMVRTVTAAEDGLLVQHRLLICDRDTKWSAPVCARLCPAG
jgi:hypothetical protein